MVELTKWQINNTGPGMMHYAVEEAFARQSFCAACKSAERAKTGWRCMKATEARRANSQRAKSRILNAGQTGCKYWRKR